MNQPKSSTTYLIEGILLFLLGIIGIVIPQLYTFGLALFVGTLLFVGGIILLIRLLTFKSTSHFFLNLLSAIILLVAGFLTIANPWAGVLTLTILLTIAFILDGLSKIFISFHLKHTNAFGWLLLSGILSLVIAGIIYSGWPGTATWVIGLLIGVDFLMAGISDIVLSRTIDNTIIV
jgi:uncharacterized membrane protein HdeD (DUF308 family)